MWDNPPNATTGSGVLFPCQWNLGLFWLVLSNFGYFVANLRTFWCTFMGLNIRDLMWFSDLENLLSIGRIFYQLGESYLNLFLLHKVENLWSVRNLWSIFTSLSALEDFLSDLGEGEGGGGFYPQISDHQFRTFSRICPTKCFHFEILYFFDIIFQS